jgi:hypothetical protein
MGEKGLGKIVTRSEHSAYMMSGNELSQVSTLKTLLFVTVAKCLFLASIFQPRLIFVSLIISLGT